MNISNLAKEKEVKKQKDSKSKLTQLLIQPIDKNRFPETAKRFKSLKGNRGKLLTFIYFNDVLSPNNASKLAIRNAKVKMKISGCFRSAQQHYAVIRSVIDTLTKNNMSILQSN